jgi:adenylate cyclase, class 2
MFEVEVKIKLKDPEETRISLKKLGAIKKYNMEHSDIYYNYPIAERDFAKTDEALRLRSTILINPDSNKEIERNHDLTYKGPKLDKTIKTRIEHVCQILDSEIMDEILLSLGFLKVLTVAKHREVYVLDNFQGKEVEMLIDQVDGLSGWYFEAEIMEEDKNKMDEVKHIILDLITKLGYNESDSISKSYLELVLENN